MSTAIPIQVHAEIFFCTFGSFGRHPSTEEDRLLDFWEGLWFCAVAATPPWGLALVVCLTVFFLPTGFVESTDPACHSDDTRATLSLSDLVNTCLTYS